MMVEEVSGEVYRFKERMFIYFEKKLLIEIEQKKVRLIDISEDSSSSPSQIRDIEKRIKGMRELCISDYNFQIDGYRIDQITAAIEEKRREDSIDLITRILEEEDIIHAKWEAV